MIAGHEYLGSDERKTLVLPALSYQWKNGWFAGTGNGIGYKFHRRRHAVRLRVTLDLGRDEDAAALAGMGDIDVRPEFGGFFNYFITNEWFLTTSFRYARATTATARRPTCGGGWSSTDRAAVARGALGVAATDVTASTCRPSTA